MVSETDPAEKSSPLAAYIDELTPPAIKALNRLIEASADIPVAWLRQKKAQIDAKTRSLEKVEESIANSVAITAGLDASIAQRAADVLIRKEYRKQVSREAIAMAAIEDLRTNPAKAGGTAAVGTTDIDDDWLNSFERFAEDASDERLQKLWGRVLAGKIREPSRFSKRTLRFLYEFSQSEAVAFEHLASCSFGESAPKKLIVPTPDSDLRGLMDLEAAGVIEGATGSGIELTIGFNAEGYGFLREGDIAVALKGKPGGSFKVDAIPLTSVGQDLLRLVPGRDPFACARRVALSIRSPYIEEACIGTIADNNRFLIKERIWIDKSNS